ncbi:MAG TPA: hypothetical protein VHO70_01665, partial [Chitinispirillaceae bacterium]|nr:hypothetical protein [Chitinispirillaceae bacterium]
MAGIDMLDLRELLGNQLKTGKYAITMTQYDWVSNTAQIHLVDSSRNTPDIPKIPESVSRQIYNGYKAAAQNVKDSALFSPSLKPPAITQTGISVNVPQKVAKKDH